MTGSDVPALREVQEWMQAALMTAAPEVDAGELVASSARLGARDHLAIYRRSYVGRLRDVMARQFPTLRHVLGPDLFRAFADDYLVTHPPTSYTLNDLGRRFDRFLDETRPDRDSGEREWWPDFMIELARFEFALNLIFDEHTDHRFEPARPDDEDRRLAPAPVLHLFHHRFPISAYYREVSAGAAPDLPLPAEEWCAVVRPAYRMDIVDLTAAQHRFLSEVQRGRPVVEAAGDEWTKWRAEMIGSGLFAVPVGPVSATG